MRHPEPVQSGRLRLTTTWWALAFFGSSSVLLVGSLLVTTLGMSTFQPTVTISGSGRGGLVLWVATGLVQGCTIGRSAQGKLATWRTVPTAR